MRPFLEQLFATGELTVPGSGAEFENDSFENEILLFDTAARRGMPGMAPALDPGVAAWAATLLAGAVRLVIVRDLGEEYVSRLFETGCPKPRSAGQPGIDYSADLFLRYLPQLVDFVKRLAPGDPLVEKLREVAASWPLSSVGMDGLVPATIGTFVGHPGLRQLYVDRIMATGDTGRVNDPAVAETILASLGAHPELSSEMAKCAERLQQPQLAD
jgi:hypothetical protein